MPTTISFSSNKAFLSQLAEHIIERNKQLLPDLSQVNIFIPNTIAADQLRHQLIKNRASGALITPYIGSMNRWVKNNIPLANNQVSVINAQSRQLLFIDAITQHPDLFKAENSWQVCEALLNLFDELIGNNAFNQKLTANEWQAVLNDAYGASTIKIQNLKAESNIVYTLCMT